MPGFLGGLFIGLTPGLILLEFLTPSDFGPYTRARATQPSLITYKKIMYLSFGL
jgi:hypothetical protein